MSHKVIVASRSFGSTSAEPWSILREGGCTVVEIDVTKTSDQDFARALGDVDGLIVGITGGISAFHIEAAPRLKVISMHGVGVSHIDLEAAKGRGIVVANCPGANANGVADLTIALMLAISRPIIAANASLKNGGWGKYPGVEVWQKTLGLVGLGQIGLGVARRAQGFEMDILVYDPYVTADQIAQAGAELVSFEELLERSDYVSLHAPLTDETRNMVNADTIRLMKPTAYLINTARGELVDEAALYDALEAELIAGGALDVFAQEPPSNLDLVNMPNVVATPHIGSHSRESTTRVSILSAKNIVQTLHTGEPLFRVV